MTRPTLVVHGTVLTLNADPAAAGRSGVLLDGAVRVDGERIGAIGSTAALLAAAPPDAEVIDVGGRVVMPGLVCLHHHFYSSFACGLAARPAHSFVEVLENLWWRLDRALTLEDAEVSAALALARAIRAGTTTVFDHHASPNALRGSLAAIRRAVEQAGVRASLCYEVTERNGGEAEAAEGLAESRALLEQLRGGDDAGGRLRAMVGVHASMTVGPRTLERCVALAREFDTGLHIHVAEDRVDQELTHRRHGCRIVERLKAAGGLGAKTLAAHAIHLEPGEMDLLRESDTAVAHNPQSNMNNGVGTAPLLELVRRGIRVGLGTDGMSSDMLAEARAALWLRRHVESDPSAGFGEVARMLLETNGAIASAHFGLPLGRLVVGGPADLVVSEHIPFTPIDDGNAAGHVLFGVAAAPVDTTVVAGRVLMRGGKLTTIDWEALSRRAARLAPAVWKRFHAL